MVVISPIDLLPLGLIVYGPVRGQTPSEREEGNSNSRRLICYRCKSYIKTVTLIPLSILV